MQTLYPEIKPYARHELAVEEPHVLYVDESGTPDGLPVVFIHGGPGAGCDALSRRFFDPNLYRIVTFDQRGCGRSTPAGPSSPRDRRGDRPRSPSRGWCRATARSRRPIPPALRSAQWS